jgi:hypothetical protein
MRRLLPALLALGIVLTSGVVDGVFTGRWVRSEALEASVERMKTLPAVVGDWVGTDAELGEAQVARAGFAGHLYRRYRHRGSGQEVMMLLACGRPGPISVHPPEVCFGGAGYQLLGPKETETITCDAAPGKAVFFTGKFGKPQSASPDQIRLYWSYAAKGDWQAPSAPRLSFGWQPVLFKLYVGRNLSPTEKTTQRDPCIDFIQELVPEVQKNFFPLS